MIKKERTIIKDAPILLDASLDIWNALMQAIIDKYQGHHRKRLSTSSSGYQWRIYTFESYYNLVEDITMLAKTIENIYIYLNVLKDLIFKETIHACTYVCYNYEYLSYWS